MLASATGALGGSGLSALGGGSLSEALLAEGVKVRSGGSGVEARLSTTAPGFPPLEIGPRRGLIPEGETDA